MFNTTLNKSKGMIKDIVLITSGEDRILLHKYSFTTVVHIPMFILYLNYIYILHILFCMSATLENYKNEL